MSKSKPSTVLDKSPYKDLYKLFDKQLSQLIEGEKHRLNQAISKVDVRIRRVETTMKRLVKKTRDEAEKELRVAESLINKEMRSKLLMSQWTNYFLAVSHSVSLDPITFAFARFSLNMCISYADVDVSYFISANIHKQMIAFANFPSEIVAGPALMALSHLSLQHPDIRSEITSANALPILLKLMHDSLSIPILIQACKLCASLSLYFPNKPLMVNSGCLHAVLDLILGTNKPFFDEDIQYAALTAVVNVIYGNDANRVLMVELDGIKPLLTSIQTSSRNDIILEGIKAIANMSHNNAFTASCILQQGGDSVLVEVLESGDILRQPVLAHAALSALANICNNEATQSHVGGTLGLIDVVLRICDHAREPYVVGEAANLLLALMWRNRGNKLRVAARGACPSLMKRIIRHWQIQDELNVVTTEKLAWALGSMLLYTSTHERMHSIGGLEEIIRICKQSTVPRTLAALGQIIGAMVPSPDELKRFHDEEFTVPVEKLQALPVLKKIKFQGFGHLTSSPDWLGRCLVYLSMTDEALAREDPWIKQEYMENLVFRKEFYTNVLPDAPVVENLDFRGMLFSIY